jgi:hypothetical protein
LISHLHGEMIGKLSSACHSAETLCEIVAAIRGIPEYKRIVFSIRNSDIARDELLSSTMNLLEHDQTEYFDYPIAASIIALADSGRDEDAIFVSSKVASDRSVEIASGIADSYLLQKALE